MSKFLKATTATLALALTATPVLAETFGLGREALPEEITAWDLDVSPDGTGLQPGSGSVLDGEVLFSQHCAACHGDFAEGVGNWPKLAGGEGTLDHEDPLKTVGSYWPHLTTAWDYINRSMPYGNAQSLTPDEVYAMTAYILYSNYLVEDDFVLSDENFLDIVLPNADGFIIDDRLEAEAHFWHAEPCMENCKDSVEITMRARVLDVTPQEEGDTAALTEPVSAETTSVEPAVEAEIEIVATAPDPKLVAAGEKAFRACKACHQVGDKAKHRVGPALNGIVGHPAGAADGFKYSKALQGVAEDGMVWTEENLTAFLADPRGFIKGNRMTFNGVRKDEDIDAIIAYLSTFSD